MVLFAGEPIVSIGSFDITNTLIDTLIVDTILIGGVFALKNKLTLVPGYFQTGAEMLVDGFYDLTASISPKHAMKIFPYFLSFFLFILLANWSGLIPGFGTIGFFRKEGFVPLLRAATSDINVTLALALISAITTHVFSIQALGIKEYLGRFFSLNPLTLFIGILELISEFTKPISLTFRLFGNIFAGEQVLGTISNIFAFLLPLPFYALEIIVGLVQSLVFSMLTMAFMAILMTSHHEEKEVTS